MTDTNPDTTRTASTDDSIPASAARSLPLAYDVPDARATEDCEYCGRPFENEGLLALHRGLAHSATITAEERSEYESAYESESAQLRRFRLKALGVLVVLYFGLLMVYAVV